MTTRKQSKSTNKPASGRAAAKSQQQKQWSSNGEKPERDSKGRFQPGHSFGWKRGESGNPRGRKGSVADALRKRLPQVRVASDGRTNADLIADMLLEEAIINRNIQAAREIFDRVEGRPRQALDLNLPKSEVDRYQRMIEQLMKEAKKEGVSITRGEAIELLSLHDERIFEAVELISQTPQ